MTGPRSQAVVESSSKLRAVVNHVGIAVQFLDMCEADIDQLFIAGSLCSA